MTHAHAVLWEVVAVVAAPDPASTDKPNPSAPPTRAGLGVAGVAAPGPALADKPNPFARQTRAKLSHDL